jgi:hypothetical protein
VLRAHIEVDPGVDLSIESAIVRRRKHGFAGIWFGGVTSPPRPTYGVVGVVLYDDPFFI